MGEGVLRFTLVDLVDNGCVKSDKGGSVITEKGESYLSQLLRKKGVEEILVKDLSDVFPHNSSVIAVMKGKLTQSVLLLRDEAVKCGAQGALIIVSERGELFIHFSVIFSDFPDGVDHA